MPFQGYQSRSKVVKNQASCENTLLRVKLKLQLAKHIRVWLTEYMPIDAAYRDKVGSLLTQRLAAALKAGDISEEDMTEPANYILENIDALETQEQLLAFLETLTSKWSFFSSILAIEKGEVTEKKDEEKVQQMEGLIKENKFDEALQVAEDNDTSKGVVN